MAQEQYRRQMATILNVDAVGYSLMMGRDEDRAFRIFEERRDLISEICEKAGGRMFGLAGDSLMAEFGSASDCLGAVLDFQEAVDRLNGEEPESWRMTFRAGINTGIAIVKGDRLIGDDVNIAARLQDIAPPSGVVISDTSYQHVNGIMAVDFVFLGEQDLKNISFPVGAYSCTRSGDVTKLVAAAPNKIERDNRHAGGPPAIAVLPFRNITSDPEMDFIADGVAGDIAAGLSRTRWLPVISRSSTFQFRDQRIDSITAGKTLGAGYVVSGTLLRSGDQLRLDASLEDVSNGQTVWTRRYDKKFSNILELQDQLGTEIIATLERQVERVEQARSGQMPWEDLETWQMVRRGRWHMQRRSSGDTALALECFEKALKSDPNSSAVLNELAWWYFWRAWVHLGAEEYLNKSEYYATKSLYVDSQDARPHAYLGACEIMRRHPERSVGHLDSALQIDPSYAFAHSGMGSAKLLLGEPQAAIGFFLDASRLSPFDIYQFHNLGELASARYHVGDYEGAAADADRSLALAPGYFLSGVVKTAALVRLGRLDLARAQASLLKKRSPEFSIERMQWIPYADKSCNRSLIDAFSQAQ